MFPPNAETVEAALAGFPGELRSRLCTQAQMGEPWYAQCCDACGEPPRLNRKLWEFAYIAHVLDSLGLLEAGRHGLGFGVGREPLVPAFANRGATIVATDLAATAREALGWARSGQHADSVEAMQRSELCDPDRFRRLVSFRPVDMRAIPGDLRGFDFCWSSCAFEHLGSLENGLNFVERSLDTLAPGGVAVHTTEYNCDSNEATIENGPTVVYRERDIRALVQRLESAGHQVAVLDLDQGDGLLDRYVDTPPYVEEPCLRRWYLSCTITSLALVIRARQD